MTFTITSFLHHKKYTIVKETVKNVSAYSTGTDEVMIIICMIDVSIPYWWYRGSGSSVWVSVYI